MNFLASVYIVIFVFSRNLLVCFHVVVDNLKQFEPAYDAV